MDDLPTFSPVVSRVAMTQTTSIFGMGKVCGAVLEDFALSEDVDVVLKQRPVLADDQK